MKLLRMGFVLGILGLITAPGMAQETGSAAKGSAINVSEIPQQSTQTTTTRRAPPTDHKRKQKLPQYLPVDKTRQPAQRTAVASPQSIETVEPETLPEISPAASLSFLALPDSAEVVPPDTFGAVGPTHLVVACASDMRISTRVGGVVSTVSQEHFWTNVARNIFDTRVVYDPYGQRFIMTAAADPGGPNPRLCIAVSDNSNPTGTWYRWSEDVDATSPVYADSPTVGFNKTWIVVQANMFNKTTFQFTRSDVYAYNKANLYANGTGQRTRLTFPASTGGSQTPATMYDPNIAVVYFAANWNGSFEGSGFLRLFSLSGGIGSERLNVTNSFGEEIFVEVGREWAETAAGDADILRQLGNSTNIYAGDSRIQNVHFRDGLLYMAHTVFLPAEAPTRAAVQWWAVTAGNGDIRHIGRVDDATGVNMFAYPSIAANQYHDVLL
ncbi:MAG TPA: hypothetical protein VFB63_22815, partial [Bryobacteraceae bacterium]|nr:hypothetical protein [Bryobacteraceae bacterium]